MYFRANFFLKFSFSEGGKRWRQNCLSGSTLRHVPMRDCSKVEKSWKLHATPFDNWHVARREFEGVLKPIWKNIEAFSPFPHFSCFGELVSLRFSYLGELLSLLLKFSRTKRKLETRLCFIFFFLVSSSRFFLSFFNGDSLHLYLALLFFSSLI